MRSLLNRRALAALALLLLAAVIAGASALSSPSINVKLTGSVSREDQNVALEQAGSVRPGEVITWDIAVANSGGAAARSINVVGDVDDGTTFIPGSATGEGVSGVKYSIEHPHDGQTFYARPMVSEQVGGEVRERPARPDEIKAVQITFAVVPANATLKATYRARVR
jgi:uncharacterized repeat protein (TIGR01451 family)